ncbi:MAG: hypothetical protein FK734_13435 [Asgard group archaeon]|nr:hypothetical protein [Asgard group archaeon]
MTEAQEKSKVATFLKEEFDKKYYFGFGIGLITLIITLILVSIFKGETVTYIEIIYYPLIVYFIFQQVLSGFGFITGYVPIAQKIIRRLTRSAKKKAYSQNDCDKCDSDLHKLENIVKQKKKEYKILEQENEKKRKHLEERKATTTNRFFLIRIKREIERNTAEKEALFKEKKKFEIDCEKEKKKIIERKGQYRRRMEEKIITKQESIDPHKFKLIMLVPLYVMMIVGIALSLFSIIKAIIVWPANAQPASEFLQRVVNVLGVLDLINEYYKGVIAAVSIITFFIIPAVKRFRNPERDIRPQIITGRKRKISDWYYRRIKKDHRTLLGRQFDDLRRYYYDIKIFIGNNLLIPIGLSQLIVAPIGGLAVILGMKTGIQRKKIERYENIILIIVASALLLILVSAYLFFYAKEIKNIHSIIAILMKTLYIIFLVYSFVIFTRAPISDVDEL